VARFGGLPAAPVRDCFWCRATTDVHLYTNDTDRDPTATVALCTPCLRTAQAPAWWWNGLRPVEAVR
jgi:hypothetical protein